MVVEDEDQALEFYTKKLGLSEVDRIRGPATVKIGTSYLELIEEQQDKELRALNLATGSTDLSIDTTLNINQVIERLGEAGIVLLKGPENKMVNQEEYQAVYLRDPDENLIEIRTSNLVDLNRADKNPGEADFDPLSQIPGIDK